MPNINDTTYIYSGFGLGGCGGTMGMAGSTITAVSYYPQMLGQYQQPAITIAMPYYVPDHKDSSDIFDWLKCRVREIEWKG